MASQQEKACIKPDEPKEIEEHEDKRIMVTFAVLLGLTITIGGLLDLLFAGVSLNFKIPIVNVNATLSIVTYYVVVLFASIYIGVVGLKELLVEKRFSVEFLMAVAALGALYLHAYFEAATVLFLYSIAEYFEGYLEDRARRTIEKLSKLMPDTAKIIADGTEKTVNVNEVEPNMTILVRPGERIPLDGNIVEGFSHIDQGIVTGESVPVTKRVNDCVYAGTLNMSGVLKIAVTKKASETLVSRIMVLVSQSGKRKASVEKLVDRFAKIYVPIVVVLAAVTAFVPTLVFGASFHTWLYRSLILLVVSCPSAFIISVPATIFVAITIAARRGVIIKGGVYMEKLSKVKHVVFDKTGTLTLGRPTVHQIRLSQRSEQEALGLAAALDQFSNHPVAQAIVRHAQKRDIDLSKFKVTEVTELPGKGIIGNVDGNFVAVGNMELMKQFDCNCEVFTIDNEDNHTAVCISMGKQGFATLCVVDQIREDALRAINDLKNNGIKTAMLTGDRTEIAKETASVLKIDEVYADLFPEDKLKFIEEIKSGNGGLVAMVGDGVNDAPALAASDVGVAMGAAGVDAALESADVVLVKDELAQIPYLIKLSDKTMKISKQNIAASIAIKVVLGALGVFGVTGLLATVIAGDDGLTMLLLLNSLRLERVK